LKNEPIGKCRDLVGSNSSEPLDKTKAFYNELATGDAPDTRVPENKNQDKPVRFSAVSKATDPGRILPVRE